MPASFVPDAFDDGFLLGLLVGEGHFGGDKKQPHVVIRMHERHLRVLKWVIRGYGGKLYGPYTHGKRTTYYQWMSRGPHLRDVLVPFLDSYLTPWVDQHSCKRYRDMKKRYRL